MLRISAASLLICAANCCYLAAKAAASFGSGAEGSQAYRPVLYEREARPHPLRGFGRLRFARRMLRIREQLRSNCEHLLRKCEHLLRKCADCCAICSAMLRIAQVGAAKHRFAMRCKRSLHTVASNGRKAKLCAGSDKQLQSSCVLRTSKAEPC